MEKKKKLKIGWFSFTCCEDSSIVFTEILNEKFFDWKELISFQHVRILKSDNKLEGLDIAFVEGAISSKIQENELREIRNNCTKLVAIGSCAVTGRPSGARNDIHDLIKDKYPDLYNQFEYEERVEPLKTYVTVDDSLSGCPMNAEQFVLRMQKYLKEFSIIS